MAYPEGSQVISIQDEQDFNEPEAPTVIGEAEVLENEANEAARLDNDAEADGTEGPHEAHFQKVQRQTASEIWSGEMDFLETSESAMQPKGGYIGLQQALRVLPRSAPETVDSHEGVNILRTLIEGFYDASEGNPQFNDEVGLRHRKKPGKAN